MAQGRLGGLDVLRGVAAACVLLLHLDQMFADVELPFGKAYLAVDFFFMLSGFVLTRTYQSRMASGELGTVRFLTIRVKRLWPTVGIGAVLGALGGLPYHAPGEVGLYLALNLALLPYLLGGPLFPLNGAFWSIFFELTANICHAAGLARVRRAVLAGLVVTMAAVMTVVAVQLDQPGYGGGWDVGSLGGNFVAGFPRVILSYCIGMLLFLSWGDRPHVRVPTWAAPIALPGVLLLGGMVEGGWPFDAAFVLVACPAILLMGLASAAPATRFARWLGDLSFPLYALHIPVFLLLPFMGLPWFAGPPLAIAIANLTGLALQRASASRAGSAARRPGGFART